MKTWLIVGGVVGAVVIAGIVVGVLFAGKSLETHYVEGPLDQSRLTIKKAFTAVCLRQKRLARPVCICAGDKVPRYMTDKEVSEIVAMMRGGPRSERLRDLLKKTGGRAGFVCGMQHGAKQTQ